MIEISKKHSYAIMARVRNTQFNVEGMNEVVKMFRKPKLTKNTLRVRLKTVESGLNGDDFVQNLISIRATYEVITFKR